MMMPANMYSNLKQNSTGITELEIEQEETKEEVDR